MAHTARNIDPAELIRSLVRLRRIERVGGDAVRCQLEPVVEQLEQLVGPTISRAKAARLLGVSQTALDRWIAKGDVSSVLTPTGRRELPVPQVVDLVDELEHDDDHDAKPSLADVIRGRRTRAAALDVKGFLPARDLRRRRRTHRTADLQALTYHRAVAPRLDEDLVRSAERRLRKWRQDGRIDPRWAVKWEQVLSMPLPRLAKAIGADTEEGRELRQTSPFAGVLTEQERRRLIEGVEQLT